MASAPTDPSDACTFVLHALGAERGPSDDVALLVLRLSPPPPGDLALQLPAEARALSHLRRVLRRWLVRTGADEQEAYDLTLAASEAGANATEHAYGPADAVYELLATVDAGLVEIVVRDFGHWRSPRGDNRGRGLLLMSALADDVRIHHGDDGTEVRLCRRLAADRTTDATPTRPGATTDGHD